MAHPDPFPLPSSVSASHVSGSTYDILIVGSGVLGTALGISLARSGRRVLLIERDLAPPHSRIVGELLQPGGCLSLAKLGLSEALKGIDAVPVKGYHIIHPSLGSVDIPYPQKDEKHLSAFEAPQCQGRSFHHGMFVGKLRTLTIGVENLDVLEGTVNELVECRTSSTAPVGVKKVLGVRVTTKEGKEKVEVLAPLTIIADGYASKFRKMVNPSLPPPIVRSYFVGIELTNPDLPAPQHGHVLLPSPPSPNGNTSFTPSDPNSPIIGPILLYALSPTIVRMLIDVSTSKTPTKAYLREHVTPLLPSRVRPSFLAALAEDEAAENGEGKKSGAGQKVKSMPNSYLPPSIQGKSGSVEGVLMAGDAMNMRHPLTGGGMTVALNDVRLLTELLGGRTSEALSTTSSTTLSPDDSSESETEATQNSTTPSTSKPVVIANSLLTSDDTFYSSASHSCVLSDWWDVRSRLTEWHWRRKGTATCINVLAMALYALFAGEDENLDVLRRGCFKYFLRGGECVAGPVALLSALNPSPALLVYHFFSVALYSIYLLFVSPPPGSKTAPSVLEYPYLTLKSLVVFWTAVRVIGPVLWSEVDF